MDPWTLLVHRQPRSTDIQGSQYVCHSNPSRTEVGLQRKELTTKSAASAMRGKMLPKSTENTVTSMLKERLAQFDVTDCRPFGSLETPAGRREVDLFCRNGGSYVIEAKFLERDLLQAVAKIQNDYIRYHEQLQIAGGFAVLYPQELSKTTDTAEVEALVDKLRFKVVMLFLPKDSRRNFRVVEGTLNDIAGTIATQILSPPEYLSPSIDFVIELLRQAAEHLTSGLRQIAGEDLEELFGGRHVFQNILEFEEGTLPEEELRLATAYLLVNQLLFYHVLSRRTEERFEEIDVDAIRSPSDLSHFFAKVLDVNYRAVFSYDVASLIPDSFVSEVKTMVSAVQGLAAEKISSDLLGTIFHDLIPIEIRKRVAAFYTNVLAAEMLASLSIDNADDKVGDLACGSGGLLVASYRRKKSLIEQTRDFTVDDHRRFLEEDLLGVDVMPFAANVAACNLALQTPEYPTDHVRVAIWDSTDLRPNHDIPSIAQLQYVIDGQTSLVPFIEHGKHADTKGVVQLGNERTKDISLTELDVVIMNPPFTRQENIPQEYKDALEDRFDDYKALLHGQMGYYAYFVLLADRFLGPEGTMALVLPVSILRHRSNEGIRRLLSEEYQVEYIITTTSRSAFSESTRLRETLLIARKLGSDIEEQPVKLVILRRIPRTTGEARRAADRLRDWQGGDFFDKSGLIKNATTLDQKELASNVDNWYRFLAFENDDLVTLLRSLLKSEVLSTVGEVCKEYDSRPKKQRSLIRGLELRGGVVQRLILISDPERAIKSSDIWLAGEVDSDSIDARHRTSGGSVPIPRDAVSPTLRRLSGLDHLRVDDDLDYVVANGFMGFDDFERQSGVRFKSETLSKVKRDVSRRLGNLHLGWRFDISAPGTHAVAFYTEHLAAPTKLFFSAALDSSTAKIVTLSMNSILGILQILSSRVETRGAFLEVFGYILERIRCLDPAKLENRTREKLVEAFDGISEVPLPSLLEQLESNHDVRIRIDKAVLGALGTEVNEGQLRRIYSEIAKEIHVLKSLMREGRK